MNKLEVRQGFSVVEVLVVIATIGILGFVGFTIAQQRRDTPQAASANSSKTVAQATPKGDDARLQAAKDFSLMFKEFEVNVTFPGSFKGLAYANYTNSPDRNDADVSSQYADYQGTIETVDMTIPYSYVVKLCTDKYGDTLGPYNKSTIKTTELGKVNKVAGQYFPTAHWETLLKQFDDFFLAFEPAVEACPNGPQYNPTNNVGEFVIPELVRIFRDAKLSQ